MRLKFTKLWNLAALDAESKTPTELATCMKWHPLLKLKF